MNLDFLFALPGTITLVLPTLAALALLARRSTRAIGIGIAIACFVLATGLAGFNAVPCVSEKVDFTSLMWCGALYRRIVAGVCAVVLAAPLGAAIGQRMGRPHAGALLGLVAIGAPGIAMVASGALLLHISQIVNASPAHDLGVLRGAVERSAIYLGTGALVGVLGALTAALGAPVGSASRTS